MTKEEIKKIILQNKDFLKECKVKSISLFGSYVRGEQKENSDIDLLVEFEEGVTLFDFVELEEQLTKIFRKKVSIISKRGLSKYIGPYILKEAELIGERL